MVEQEQEEDAEVEEEVVEVEEGDVGVLDYTECGQYE